MYLWNVVQNSDGTMKYYNTPIHEHSIDFVRDVSYLIDQSIPNFKSGWFELGKYMNDDKSRWLKNLNPLFECIGTGHYTILKSLNFIRLSKNKGKVYHNDSEQRFKNIFFHYGVITDCAYQIARCLVIIKSNLGLIEYSVEKLSLDEIYSKVKSWYGKDGKNYKDRYADMFKYGLSINVDIQPGRDRFFEILDKNKKFTNDYIKFRESIQSYRNSYIHNPMIDVFRYNGAEYVIDNKADKKKSIKINDYRYLSQLDNLDKKYLIKPHELIERNFNLLVKGLDSLWTLYSAEIKVINCNENLDIILCRADD